MAALARILLVLTAALLLEVAPTSAAQRHAEVLPAGVREVDVHSSRDISRHVTDPGTVAKIVRWFDALPIAPSTHYYCPFIRYRPPTTFYFRAGSGALVAHARTPGAAACGGSFDFSVRGRVQKPLLVGNFLVRVGRLLGLRLVPVVRLG
jgi:hypothetical protein